MAKIKKYSIELEVLTPVHIAGAEYKSKLDKKEYLFNSNTQTLTIIDNEKFISFLIKKNLFENYIEFIQENMSSKIQIQKRYIKLLDFLKKYNIYSNLKEFTKKEYNNLDIENKNLNDIKLLNRNIYDEIFLQGSSIKGALINLLLINYLKENRKEFVNEKNKIYTILNQAKTEIDIKEAKRKVAQIVNEIEKKIIYNDDNNLLKSKKFGISISDSYNYEEKNTNFYQDIDERISDKKTSRMPILREYIMPKSKFFFDITIDYELLEKTRIKIKNFEELTKLLSDSSNFLLEEILRIKSKGQNLILGANTGFLQKTIIYSLFEDKKERLEVIRKILHKNRTKAILNHLNDKFSPRIINRVKIYDNLELAGLVKIKKVSEKNVGTS